MSVSGSRDRLVPDDAGPVRVQPRRLLLVQTSVREHQPGQRQRRDEHRHPRPLPRDRIGQLHPGARPVDLHRVPRDMCDREGQVVHPDVLGDDLTEPLSAPGYDGGALAGGPVCRGHICLLTDPLAVGKGGWDLTMKNAAGGARITLLSQWVKFAVQLASFVVMARLLTPSDFGVVAMVSVVVAFATLLADSGLTLAGIQAETLTDKHQDNLFWLNLLAGATSMVLVALSGPLLAWFYGDDRLILLAIVLSSTLLLNGLAVQFRVSINRQLRFSALAAQDVVSVLAGFFVATAMAILGAGYWALAGQVVTQSGVLLVMATIQARWWPGRPNRTTGMRGLLWFGTNSLGLQSLNLLSRSTDVMTVGRSQGSEALGLYTRANQLVAMSFQQLVTPLTRVVIPRLARELSIESLNDSLLRLQRVIVYTIPAVVSILASVAGPLVIVFLGEAWSSMAAIVQVLCVGAAFQAFGYIYYWGFLAVARAGTLLLSELPGRVFMIVGAIIVAGWGVIPVSWVMSLGLVIIWATSTMVYAPRSGIDAKQLTVVALPPALLFSAAFGAVYIVDGMLLHAADGVPAWQALLIETAVWISTAALGLLVPTVRRNLRMVLSDLRSLGIGR